MSSLKKPNKNYKRKYQDNEGVNDNEEVNDEVSGELVESLMKMQK